MLNKKRISEIWRNYIFVIIANIVMRDEKQEYLFQTLSEHWFQSRFGEPIIEKSILYFLSFRNYCNDC